MFDSTVNDVEDYGSSYDEVIIKALVSYTIVRSTTRFVYIQIFCILNTALKCLQYVTRSKLVVVFQYIVGQILQICKYIIVYM